MNIGFSDLYTWISGQITAKTTAATTSHNTSWNTSFNTTLNANTSTIVSTSISTITSWLTSWVSSYQVNTQYDANTSWVTSWTTAVSFNTSATAYTNVNTSATAYYARTTSGIASYYRTTSRSTTYSRNTTVTQNYSANTSRTTSVSYTTSWTTSSVSYRSQLTSRSTDDGAATCIVEGTMVTLADGSKKPIESVKLGDSLMSRTGIFNTDVKEDLFAISSDNISGEKSTATIQKLYRFLSKGIVNINNGKLETTSEHYHIIKRSDKWICVLAGDLLVNDMLLDINGDGVIIESLSIDNTNTKTVYLIDTEDLDTFYANDIYTHNAKIKF